MVQEGSSACAVACAHLGDLLLALAFWADHLRGRQRWMKVVSSVNGACVCASARVGMGACAQRARTGVWGAGRCCMRVWRRVAVGAAFSSVNASGYPRSVGEARSARRKGSPVLSCRCESKSVEFILGITLDRREEKEG
eukprot:6204855-Pleurochrysis_carterae.AAC.1